ncbi:NUDIX domain-containing protein [Patescibacteria group bacterium]
MKVKKVAGVVFYDKKLNLAFQVRGNYSKVGESYSFFGGQLEPGETPKEALLRELSEEISYKPKKITFWDVFEYTIKEKGGWHGIKIIQHVFLSPITPALLKTKVYEGDGIIVMNLNKAIKGEGFPKNSTRFLNKLREKLNNPDTK